ncbi:MAG: cyclic beta,2-glucan synthetase [Acidobacteriota bacterium]|nr:cyclic beta,2-glucan synthetase [Acidobacteriota bacterium]
MWSAGYQPSGVEPDSYDVVFSEDRAEIVRRDHAITSRLEVVVTPEDDAEVRRVSLTNHGSRMREIELTSYAEVVLAPPAADRAHPAFSNLFVETEWIPNLGALLASRRPRSASEPRLWAAHVSEVAVAAGAAGPTGSADGDELQFETDRLRFLGRGRVVGNPMSVIDGMALSNTAGAVLDPIFSLRRRVRLAPGTTVRVTFTTLVAPSREAALTLADRYRDPAAFERAAAMAWTQAQVQLRHLDILPEEASLFQRLANRVLYSDRSLRPPPEILAHNTHDASALWTQSCQHRSPNPALRRRRGRLLRRLQRVPLRSHARPAQDPLDLRVAARDSNNSRSPQQEPELPQAVTSLVASSLDRSPGFRPAAESCDSGGERAAPAEPTGRSCARRGGHSGCR